MNIDTMLLAGLYFVALLTAIAFLYQRARWRRRKAEGKGNWGFYPSAGALGNALQQLSVMAQPQETHVVEEKQSEESEDDEDGAPKDPRAHLLRQTEKIRRGEKVDHLTAIKRF